MVGQIVSFGDLLAFVDNGKDSNGKSDLESSEIITGWRADLCLFKSKEKTCLEAHILSIEQLKE